MSFPNLLLLFPLGIPEVAIVAGALVIPLAPIAAAGYFLALGPGHNLFPHLSFGTIAEAVSFALIGLLWLLAGQYLVLGVARVHAVLARALLGPTRQTHLEVRVAALSESRLIAGEAEVGRSRRRRQKRT